jgi:hypothetical protein
MKSADRFPGVKDGVYRLSDEERAAVRRALQEVRDGRIASDEDIAALFDRFRKRSMRI